MTRKFRAYKIVTPDKYFNMWVLLQQTVIAYSRVWRNRIKELGIGPGQTSVLFVLINRGGTSTTSEISQWLARERHTITGFINQMERAGLVRRQKDHQDKRFTTVSITEKGRNAYRRLAAPNPIVSIVSHLKDADLDCLVRCLDYIRLESLKLMHPETEVVSVAAKLGY